MAANAAVDMEVYDELMSTNGDEAKVR